MASSAEVTILPPTANGSSRPEPVGATDTKLHRDVAIKVLPSEVALIRIASLDGARAGHHSSRSPNALQ